MARFLSMGTHLPEPLPLWTDKLDSPRRLWLTAVCRSARSVRVGRSGPQCQCHSWKSDLGPVALTLPATSTAEISDLVSVVLSVTATHFRPSAQVIILFCPVLMDFLRMAFFNVFARHYVS